MKNKKYWIWLSLVKEIGNKKKRELLEIYKSPQQIYSANILQNEIKNKMKNKIEIEIEKHILYMQKNNIDIISINDEEYPKNLKQIYDPPISIYIKGNKEILNEKAIAIVGCREASDYGKKAAKYFAYNLTNKGINIVSGLAKGIDSYSHIGSICADSKNSGKTIAVIGNGLDTVYPKENKYLFDKIVESGGAIISEYPLGTKPEKMNFPARNRIISGISKGIIVVEAKEKSGTLITVDFALEQGKDVYVVPGNINSINSVGTNHLIKQGARVVTCYEDVEI